MFSGGRLNARFVVLKEILWYNTRTCRMDFHDFSSFFKNSVRKTEIGEKTYILYV